MFWTNRSLSHNLIMKAAYITNKSPAYLSGMAAVSLSYENVWAQSRMKWWQLRVELLSLRGWIMFFFYFPSAFSIYCYLSLLWTLWFIMGLLGMLPARCSWLMVVKPKFRGSYNVLPALALLSSGIAFNLYHPTAGCKPVCFLLSSSLM